MPVNVYGDKQDLVPTSKFDFVQYPFDYFNPVQSRVVDFVGHRDNLLVASMTGSGKTVAAELLLAEEIRHNKKKGLYVAPLRALAGEKLKEWRTQFHDLKICICTGDYRFTPQRKYEIEAADLIVMTPEMLNVCVRNYRSEKNRFIHDVGSLVFDEFHTIGDEGRGHHIENALIKLAGINPDTRFAFLSATMPNAEQIAEWTEKLTGHSCNVIRSEYRPCPLNIHFPIYRSSYNYDENESHKVSRAMDLIERYSSDKFIAFVLTKRTGEQLLKRLEFRKIESAFHNADLAKERRKEIEDRFRNDPTFRVLVATSTVEMGLNMPARRVVILGVHRAKIEVSNSSLHQMAGRAGRPGLDPEGDAYILLPDLQVLKYKEKILTPTPIESRLSGTNTLAFHLISEVHHRHIQTLSDVDDWYKKSLAFHQRGYAGMVDCHDALQRLEAAKCIKIDGESLEVTGIGAAASMFYYNPFDTSALHRNFRKLFDSGREGDAEFMSFALSCIPSFRAINPTVAEMEDLQSFQAGHDNAEARAMFSKDLVINGEVRAAYCYQGVINDRIKFGTSLGTLSNTLKLDFDRLGEMLMVLDEMAGKWGRATFFNNLKAKIVYGVEAKYVPLVRISGIGPVKAEKLYAIGLHTLKHVADNPALVASALRCKPDAATKISQEAKTLVLSGV